VLHYIRQERFAADKQPSLLDQFVSYEENEMLWILTQELYSQHFIVFVTYEWAQ
jgi:hypothetical protein